MRKFYFLGLILLLKAPSFAADRYWVGGASGNWNSSANWSASSGGAGGASVPAANDHVIFNNGFSTTVNYDLPGNDIGFSGFTVTNSTELILINTISATRSITINNNSGTYYTVVAAGSTLRLRSNTNTVFNFGSASLSSGRMVFDGNVACENQAVNTSNGPRLLSQDSIIINAVCYVGPSITQTGSNPSGSRFRFSNGSRYQIDKNGGVVPGGKWERGSLIQITGTAGTFPSTWLGSGVYGSVEINAPAANGGSIASLQLPSNTVFQGDFTVNSLGTSAGIRFASTPSVTIDGNFVLNNGIVSLANSASSGFVIVNGNFTQVVGTILDLQAGSGNTILQIKSGMSTMGTIRENGTSTGSRILFNGTASQALSFDDASLTNDVSFEINNAAGAVVSSDWDLPNSANSRLILTSGNINMGANTLFIQNPATTALAGGTVSSHIIGKMRRATGTAGAAYDFSVSDIAGEAASVKIYPASAASDYTVSFTRPNANNINAVPAGILRAGNYAWDIVQNAGTGANLNFDFGNFAQGGITNVNAVRVLHWNGASWDNLGGTYLATNTIDVTGVTSFSPFTLGSTVDLLPVRFADLKASRQGSHIAVEWTNRTESNIRHYITERSADGIRFIPIATVGARSNQNSSEHYRTADLNPLNGVNYYRIRAVELDGNNYLTTVVKLNSPDFEGDLSVYPNPATGGPVSVQVPDLRAGNYQLSVLNAGGQQVFAGELNHRGGAFTQTLQLPYALQPGLYNLQLKTAHAVYSKSFIIR